MHTLLFSTGRRSLRVFVVLLFFGGLAAPLSAQTTGRYNGFTFVVTGQKVSLTGYVGAGGAVTVPAFIPSDRARFPVGELPAGLFKDQIPVTSVTIPPIANIDSQEMFRGCLNLTGVSLPATLTSMGPRMFFQCRKLTGVNIPDGVTSIHDSAFAYCDRLAGVDLPDGVSFIGGAAFRSCTSLTRVTLPASVTTLRGYAFDSCTSLTSALFEGDAPPPAVDVFGNTAPGFTVYYREGSEGFASPTWRGYASVMIPRLVVTSFTRQGTVVSLTVAGGVQGWTYVLQRSPDLGVTPWATAATLGPLPVPGSMILTDSASFGPANYYRVTGQAP